MKPGPEIFLAGNDEHAPLGEFIMKQIRAIDEVELRKFNVALDDVHEFAAHLALFRILEKNFAELLAAYQSFRDAFMTSHEMNPTINDVILDEMNRLLINYLSSFRTVVDHYTTRYTRLDRTGSTYLTIFETATANAFDTSFAYRFFSKLRNFVQHCGLPVEGVSAELALSSDGATIANFGVYFERDALLAKFDKWGPVKADLEVQPERIEVSSQLEACHKEIRVLFRVLARLELQIIEATRDYLLHLAEEVEAEYPGATPVIGDFSQLGKTGGELPTLRIPVGELVRIREISGALDTDANYIFGA